MNGTKSRIVFHAPLIKLPKINYKLAIIFTFFVCGLIIGSACIAYGSDDIVNAIDDIFESTRKSRLQSGFLDIIIGSFLTSFLYFLTSFILGLCAAGIPFILLIPAVKGVYLGAVTSIMYSMFGLSGVGYCALILFPGAAIMLASLFFACSSGIGMSLELCRIITKKSSPDDYGLLKMYCIRYGVLLLIALFASVTDAVLLKAFGSFFSF